MKVFLPVSEGQVESLGLSPEDLVPFDLDYVVMRPGESFPDQQLPVEILEAKPVLSPPVS